MDLMPESMRMFNVQAPVIPIFGRMVRETPGTISFGQGVAHYTAPPETREAVIRFFENPENHKYHAVDGIPQLKEALIEKLQNENRLRFKPDSSPSLSLCVTAGGNMAFLNAVLAVADSGDEIIILKPFYFNHEMAVRIAGCMPVFADTDSQFQPVLSSIEAAITDRTKAVLTVSPNNPTGAVYSKSTLKAINDLCRERRLFHIHDEAYEYFTYDGVEAVSPGSFSQANQHTISLYSFSKAYGFAGWRVGYMTYPEQLENAVHKIQDTNLICPPIVSQHAALGALEAGPGYCRAHLPAYQTLRDRILEELAPLGDACRVSRADGAFYLFMKIDSPLPPLTLARRLILEHGVALMPGDAFGMDQGCTLRLSYGAVDHDSALEGINRLKRGLSALAGDK